MIKVSVSKCKQPLASAAFCIFLSKAWNLPQHCLKIKGLIFPNLLMHLQHLQLQHLLDSHFLAVNFVLQHHWEFRQIVGAPNLLYEREPLANPSLEIIKGSKRVFSQTSHVFLMATLECHCSPIVWMKFKEVVTWKVMNEWCVLSFSFLQHLMQLEGSDEGKIIIIKKRTLHKLLRLSVRCKLFEWGFGALSKPEHLRASQAVSALGSSRCKPKCLQWPGLGLQEGLRQLGCKFGNERPKEGRVVPSLWD